MGFFDVPDEAAQPPGPPDRLYAQHGPAGANNPEQYYLPALLPWTRELARSEDAVVALSGIRIWPDSCVLGLVIFTRRRLPHQQLGSLFGHPMETLATTGGFRFGVLFADGRRVTTRDQNAWRPGHPGRDPDAPTLRPGGGGGGGFSFRIELTLAPLPPDGPLTLVVEWTDRGIAETRTELDASAIRAAADGATEIWSDLPPPPAGGTAQLGFGHTQVRGSWSGGSAVGRRVEPPPEGADG